jgi:hypothetical protein
MKTKKELKEQMSIGIIGHKARIKEIKLEIKEHKEDIKRHKLLMKQAKISCKLQLLENRITQ